jgi:hypothetical protein
MPKPRRAILLLCTLSAFALPGLAAGASMADRWVGGLKEIDQKLRAQQWDEAGKQARQLGRRMVGEAGRDKDVAYSFAVVSVFQAIAEAGLGNQEEAAWYWDTALNLVPGIASTNLAPYGALAAELKKRSLRSAHQAPHHPGDLWTTDGQEIPSDKIERPKVIRDVMPEIPSALAHEGVLGGVVVEAIIGTDGRVRQPVVLSMEGEGPAVKYTVLESLGQWRFEPARLEGKPIAVYYVLTINFRVGR